ncbi:hypothetical protein CRG98_040941 [Punica granatum]|uniref:Uncharacterized protein n=1 Tax=Punica granatum TaxID=22663 RepID=A0A2I0I3S8_PUNGR|nr:hypothetical protein CRG98_040941 [Punica granatum]
MVVALVLPSPLARMLEASYDHAHDGGGRRIEVAKGVEDPNRERAAPTLIRG